MNSTQPTEIMQRDMPQLRLLTLLLISSVMAVGCTDASTGSSSGATTQLDSARDRWEGHDLQNYTFQFRWVCFCMREYVQPARLTVRDGMIVSGVDPESGEALEPDRLDDFRTIDELFGDIEQAIADSAEEVRLSFDPMWGFPNDVYIDRSRMIADEERGWIIESFSE